MAAPPTIHFGLTYFRNSPDLRQLVLPIRQSVCDQLCVE